MQMTSQKPCLCTRQDSEMVMVAIYLGNIVTNPRGVLYTLVSLSMQRFVATDGNLKCAVFRFKLSSHHHIYIVESLFSNNIT